jgi:predicted Holliday junction resolvase-like endonuclease
MMLTLKKHFVTVNSTFHYMKSGHGGIPVEIMHYGYLRKAVVHLRPAGQSKLLPPALPSRMSLVDLIFPIILALALGFVLGILYVKAQITAIEARYRAELETWKLEATGAIRKDSVNRSRSTLKGKIAEQMAPLLPEFRFNPADARFIGSPVDYVIFDGLTDVADEKKSDIRIVFMDIKHGTGSLTRTQRVIRDAVMAKQIFWETLRVASE